MEVVSEAVSTTVGSVRKEWRSWAGDWGMCGEGGEGGM